jgi:hypothetical protein
VGRNGLAFFKERKCRGIDTRRIPEASAIDLWKGLRFVDRDLFRDALDLAF